MSNHDPVAELFLECYNLDLAALSCPARVTLPPGGARAGLELRDDAGRFLYAIPRDTAPEMAAIAYHLFMLGIQQGMCGQHTPAAAQGSRTGGQRTGRGSRSNLP